MNKIVFTLLVVCVLVAAVSAAKGDQTKELLPPKGGARKMVKAQAPEKKVPAPAGGKKETHVLEGPKPDEPLMKPAVMPPSTDNMHKDPSMKNDAVVQGSSIKGLKERFQKQKATL